jgi:hypothetical protein
MLFGVPPVGQFEPGHAVPGREGTLTRHLIGGLAVLTLVFGAVGCASGHGQVRTAATTAASTTASPTPTPSPTVTPLTGSVSLLGTHPRDGSSEGVIVSTLPRAWISIVAHFPAGAWRKSARADASGFHTFWYTIGSATPGYPVKVNVVMSAHGQKVSSRAWFTPRPRPAPPAPKPAPTPTAAAPPTTAAPPAPSGCYPRASSGNCYQPGEFCPQADAGMSGIDSNGNPIICENNNGLRWEPA